ncbi:single-stranded DNA-binding protein [Salinibacterium sp. dk2585]|uniref:single-stranded DNA-binding protein n=1 Tax=unclassified Salinibacterium TaxID=2632331 RepID=UPI0011C24BBA|nr:MULTISPECIES: single-stranded DNA-binding protein [unclassified Salinibacterium]QEE61499.1 single-stranded DNA-binding protein [Salinibacterium sp. dk2585]TXK54176.1 single-stranded DNA-binding protein [Salinibacterium sp. dk5596]
MTDTITLTGLVATEPKHLTTSEGLPITSFRLVSTQRRYDRAAQSWVDGDTNWYTVTAFRRLASNASVSLQKGQRVLLTGRLRLRDWQSGDRSGLTVEVEAESIGHDLMWGTASFSRNSVVVSAPEERADAPAETSDPVRPLGDSASDWAAAPAGALQDAGAEKPF